MSQARQRSIGKVQGESSTPLSPTGNRASSYRLADSFCGGQKTRLKVCDELLIANNGHNVIAGAEAGKVEVTGSENQRLSVDQREPKRVCQTLPAAA